jgi:hypothetical protein
LFWALSYLLAPTINIDGFFTSDYYTTLIFIFAGFVSLSLRYWNPFTCSPLLYTKSLWMNGEDEFVKPGVDGGEAKKVTLSLYEWIHLSPDDRADYIFKYARSVSDKEVKGLSTCDDNDPKRDVISVSYCTDSGLITCYILGKVVPRLLGIPHGVHGKIQHPKDGKYEVQWKRVIGCGGLKDFTIEHIRFLVDVKKVLNSDTKTIYKEDLDKLRDALCSGPEKVDILSEQGKDFIVGCALKWHYLKGSEDMMQHNMEASLEDRKEWPQRYMTHMKLWSDRRSSPELSSAWKDWDEFIGANHVFEDADPLKFFWAKSTAKDSWKTFPQSAESEECLLEHCRWEGCVEPHMVLESNAEWICARQLLGLQSLNDMHQLPSRAAGAGPEAFI